ncbi:MAG: thiamine-phosphate pyrophosphorylase [candidate division WOR-3 bacterium]
MDERHISRIIDVNLNRLTEGLRVVEDVVRLGLERPRLLSSIRTLRTRVSAATRVLRRRVIASRDSGSDLGRGGRFDRTTRSSLEDVLLANFKRAEEAARVLEEVLKVAEPKLAGRMKAVRFRLYDLEKRVADEVRRQRPECRSQNKKVR